MLAALLCGLFYGWLAHGEWRRCRLHKALNRELAEMEHDTAQEMVDFYRWLEDYNNQEFWQKTDSTGCDDANLAYYGPWMIAARSTGGGEMPMGVLDSQTGVRRSGD